jgi:hypothetical protein
MLLRLIKAPQGILHLYSALGDDGKNNRYFVRIFSCAGIFRFQFSGKK